MYYKYKIENKLLRILVKIESREKENKRFTQD